jgi:hypothetical protein
MDKTAINQWLTLIFPVFAACLLLPIAVLH